MKETEVKHRNIAFMIGKNIMKRILFVIILLSVIPAQTLFADTYAVISLKGSVNPITSEYIVDSIQKANKAKSRFIVIQMDTPGGLVASMDPIIQEIMKSNVPVVVYTYPKGARAASAGGYIMLSAHIAVMSPGTRIGAMHPSAPSLDFMKKDKKGQPAGVMEKKVLSDFVAFARSLAQERNRNVRWAERAVKDAISSTSIEAKKAGVIDFIAEDMPDLLTKLNNRQVTMGRNRVILRTAGIREFRYEMDWQQNFLNFFADPQVILLLLVIAVIGIGMEVKNPGMIFPGVIGAISIFIFLTAVRILPVNIAGIILILLAIVLFVMELQITSYGLLTIGGIAAFVFGSMILFDSPLPGGQIPMQTIIITVLFILAFVFIVVRAVLHVHKTRVTTGLEGLMGEKGEATGTFQGKGKIKIHGEIWHALSKEKIEKDETVKVTDVDGMTLHVEKITDEE